MLLHGTLLQSTFAGPTRGRWRTLVMHNTHP